LTILRGLVLVLVLVTTHRPAGLTLRVGPALKTVVQILLTYLLLLNTFEDFNERFCFQCPATGFAVTTFAAM
jgi:hypothetical protein